MRNDVKIKMRKFRENNSKGVVEKNERKYDEKNANKERIRKKRENETEEEKKVERKAAKDRMALLRAIQTDEEKEFEREKDRKRKQKIRANKAIEDIQYENVIKRLGILKQNKLMKKMGKSGAESTAQVQAQPTGDAAQPFSAL